MDSLFQKIKTVSKNGAFIYIFSRYATYIIQFINSMFIAVYLGPFYLGIWGFLNLILGYIAQFNFGIPQSVNVIVSVNKQDNSYVTKVVSVGIVMTVLLSVLVLLLFGLNKLDIIDIGSKYNLNLYIYPLIIISILTHFNGYLSNIFRIYGDVAAIAINQSLLPLLILIVTPFFRKEELLWAMLYASCAACFISSTLYLMRFPIRFKPLFDWDLFKFIQIKGWYLFIYHASFYLILLSTRSFISSNYSIEEFGYFTFSFSLANVVLLLLNSISFLIFPKMLNRFSTANNEQTSSILFEIRSVYISLSHLLIHFVIMIFPLFLYFFPTYQESSLAFKVISLTVVLYTNSFGYLGLLMAKGRDKLIGNLALVALLLNVLLSVILVYVFQVSFSFVILSTLITYLCYVFVSGMYGRKQLGLSSGFMATLKDIYPLRMMFPFMLSLGFVFFNVNAFYFILPFLLYTLFNFKDLLKIKNVVQKMLANPNFINI